MASLGELTRQHSKLTADQAAHLQRLVSDWGMLADLCFADVLLYLPAGDGRWVVVAHVRPVTGQTIYIADWVGEWAGASEVEVLEEAFSTRTIVEHDVHVESVPAPVSVLAIPVSHKGVPIAVLTRESSPQIGRIPGELETTYLSIFDRFATMIQEGSYPFGTRSMISAAPRVGDGAMVLDDDARVRYASPNAVSVLHRLGITSNLIGMHLAELGFNDGSVASSYERKEPVLEEFDRINSDDVSVLTYSIPLMQDGKVTGGVLLLRDVTELRRRDRLLLSKDATIREIHHRVKNNLQTISSLLRLQSRRLTNNEAKAAVNESVRRIRTIALVHETLSREAGDDVAFIEIVRPLIRLAEEGLQSPDRPVRFVVRGDGGKLPATVATPLSVVLTELLQNAVDHGFPEGSSGGTVVVVLANDGKELKIDVFDDGLGVAPDFHIENATGLGLVIVRTLVTTELAGKISMRQATSTELQEAGLTVPNRGAGTVVELTVPL